MLLWAHLKIMTFNSCNSNLWKKMPKKKHLKLENPFFRICAAWVFLMEFAVLFVTGLWIIRSLLRSWDKMRELIAEGFFFCIFIPGHYSRVAIWHDHRRIFAKGDFYFILLIFMNVLLLLKVLNDFNKSNFRINHVL